MARYLGFLLAAGAALASPSLPAATLTVDIHGGADYADIQSAIDAAQAGDTVLVKPGEYVIAEPINFNRDRSLLGRGARDPDDPLSPPVKNIIVRSEAGPELTTIRMSSVPADPGRASVVVFEHGENENSVLEGFTLTGGKGTVIDEHWPGSAGGGILCRGGHPHR